MTEMSPEIPIDFTPFIVAMVVVFVIIVGFSVFAQGWVKMAPNYVLVIFRRGKQTRTSDGRLVNRIARIVRQYGTFVWPMIEYACILPLGPFQCKILLPRVHLAAGAPIRFTGRAHLQVANSERALRTAAEYMCGCEGGQQLIDRTIEGHIHAVLGTVTRDQLQHDPAAVAARVQEAAADSLARIGLDMLSFEITQDTTI